MTLTAKQKRFLYYILIAILIAALVLQVLADGTGLPGENIALGLIGAASFALWGGWCLPVILARDPDYYHAAPQDGGTDGKEGTEHE